MGNKVSLEENLIELRIVSKQVRFVLCVGFRRRGCVLETMCLVSPVLTCTCTSSLILLFFFVVVAVVVVDDSLFKKV